MARPKSAVAKTFAAVSGSHISDADAEVIGPVIEAIASEGGGLGATPKAVVEHARSSNSPLHRFFDWDDSSAAEKYRIEQAKYLVRSVKVVVVGPSGATESRAFFSVQTDDGHAYRDAATVFTDESLVAQLVAGAKRDADAWRKRHAAIRKNAELAPLFAAIDAVLDGEESEAAQ